MATRLTFTTTVGEQWRSVTGPWLREQARFAWRETRPTIILAPSRAEGFYLRRRLIDERLPFLGLRFWTPSDTRKFLLRELLPKVGAATQGELRLLARSCAEELLRRKNVTDTATLNSVVLEPDPFLRAYDLLSGAGWDPVRQGAAYGRALADQFSRELKTMRLATQSGIHQQLRRESMKRKTPLIANLLVVGFNATHWPLWDLLRTMVTCGEQAVVALSKPRFFGEGIDQLWASSWEEATGVEALVPEGPLEEEASPFTEIASSYERGEANRRIESDMTFLVTPELTSHVKAVVLQVIDYLKRDDCARLGIVFPEANALALGVAAKLRQLGIPLNDGTGAIQPGLFERRAWQSWLDWQRESSVQNFVLWLRACEIDKVSSGLELSRLSASEVADCLESALGETLVDDLNFLTRHLEENSTDHRAASVAVFLRKRVELPVSATFSEFLATTRRSMEVLDWKNHLTQLQIDPPRWLLERSGALSRRTFLAWLEEATDSRETTRGAEGNHFYGKVHLLIYAQMTGQTWSHLILTGLNEGVWPRLFETGAFGSRHELTMLNKQARSLNRHGTREGSQGTGQEIVQPDRGYCLLPQDRYDLALRDLCAALETTSTAICLTAMTTEAGRSLLPSDFFSHVWQVQSGRALDETAFRNLAPATLDRIERHEHLHVSNEIGSLGSASLEATRLAYDVRRDATQSFGPYEFAFQNGPPQPVQLSCKTWQDAWNHPSSVWLQKIVGVSRLPEGTLSWSQTTGTWVHQWIRGALLDCAERNSSSDFLVLLRERIDREPARVQARARASGVELYPWWDQVYHRTRGIALGLGESLAPHLQHKQILSEFNLPRALNVALPGADQADFVLRGRIDLLLVAPGSAPCDPRQGNFTGCTCWVIDFKTGSAPLLSAAKIAKGEGLQPVLYALAVRAAGAGPTVLSLHIIDTPLKAQVDLDNVLVIGPIFRSIDLMHRRGIFGMRTDAESDYGYAPPYPMATQFIPANVLEAKWTRVHGAAERSGE